MVQTQISSAVTVRQYLLYGFLGVPLAFGALPLYMHIPKVYAETTGMSLLTIGVILWLSRGVDAITDPWFGRLAAYVDKRALMVGWLVVFAVMFYALCNPPNMHAGLTAVWLTITLTLAGVSFSAAGIAYQTWGAGLGDNSHQRSALVLSREAITLIAVIIAAVIPTLVADELADGVKVLSGVLIAVACIVVVLSFRLPSVAAKTSALPVIQHSWRQQLSLLWANTSCRWLLLIFLINATASAMPATLFLFFVEDVLQAKSQSGYFLVLYFLAGVFTMPLWTWLTPRCGRTLLWQISMLIAMLAFVIAGFLGAGDSVAFAMVCVFSGAALGADLCLPASMAADCGEQHNISGILFGWWNVATKLSLAIAGGLALPILAVVGYETGAGGDNAVALKVAYVFVPVAIKMVALIVLTKKQHDLHVLNDLNVGVKS